MSKYNRLAWDDSHRRDIGIVLLLSISLAFSFSFIYLRKLACICTGTVHVCSSKSLILYSIGTSATQFLFQANMEKLNYF